MAGLELEHHSVSWLGRREHQVPQEEGMMAREHYASLWCKKSSGTGKETGRTQGLMVYGWWAGGIPDLTLLLCVVWLEHQQVVWFMLMLWLEHQQVS